MTLTPLDRNSVNMPAGFSGPALPDKLGRDLMAGTKVIYINRLESVAVFPADLGNGDGFAVDI